MQYFQNFIYDKFHFRRESVDLEKCFEEIIDKIVKNINDNNNSYKEIKRGSGLFDCLKLKVTKVNFNDKKLVDLLNEVAKEIIKEMQEKKIALTKENFREYVNNSETWLTVIKEYIMFVIVKLTARDYKKESSFRERLNDKNITTTIKK